MKLSDTDRRVMIAALGYMRSVWTGPVRDHCQHLIDELKLDFDVKQYTCPRCGSVSSHPDDVINRYCGECHRFEE